MKEAEPPLDGSGGLMSGRPALLRGTPMRAAAAAAVAVAISCIALLAGGRLHGQVAMADRREVEVPKKMLAAIGRELASDASNMAALKGKVSRLDRTVSKLRLQRASRGRRGADDRAVGLQAMAEREGGGADHNREVNVAAHRRMLVEKQMEFLRDFQPWAANSGLMDSAKGHGQSGVWNANRGPPYVSATTLFAGSGVDKKGSGNLVRRILGLKTTFRFHKWQGNSFLTSFDGPQFRFLYRNAHSSIVVPPLVKDAGPLLGWNAIHRLYLYVNEGHNSLIVVGGPGGALFINNNVINKDGGYDLKPKWAPGPYERQSTVEGTSFAACATTLPGPGTSVHGVSISSLPSNAVSLYESGDVSVVFSIPSGSGSVIYLGFDFSEPVTPWVHALIAASQFQEFDLTSRHI